MSMAREASSRSRQMEICLRLLSTSIGMRFFLAIPYMQSILSDYTGTAGRWRNRLSRRGSRIDRQDDSNSGYNLQRVIV